MGGTLLLCFAELVEQHTTRRANRLYTTIDALSIYFLQESAIHVHNPEARCEEPDMVE